MKKIRNHKSKLQGQTAAKVRYGLRFQILPDQSAGQRAKEVVPRARGLRETTFILPLQKPFTGRVQMLSKGAELIVRPGIKLPFGGMLVLFPD